MNGNGAMRKRKALASALEHLITAAEQPRSIHTSAVPVNSEEVLRNSGLIYSLAGELREEQEVSPDGVALLKQLLHDGSSPVYAPVEGALELELRRARAALVED
jgi:hypothetical protein